MRRTRRNRSRRGNLLASVLPSRRRRHLSSWSWKTSARATICRFGPAFRKFCTAPVPRPPQPTSPAFSTVPSGAASLNFIASTVFLLLHPARSTPAPATAAAPMKLRRVRSNSFISCLQVWDKRVQSNLHPDQLHRKSTTPALESLGRFVLPHDAEPDVVAVRVPPDALGRLRIGHHPAFRLCPVACRRA